MTEITSMKETAEKNWYRKEVDSIAKSLTEAKFDVGVVLAESRKEMYEALDKFFARVQSFVGLFVAIFTLVVAVTYFWLKEKESIDLLPFAAIALCVFAVFFGLFVAIPGLRALYELYVASVIYASQLHEAVGIGTHRWFEYVKEYVEGDVSSTKVGVAWWSDYVRSIMKTYGFLKEEASRDSRNDIEATPKQSIESASKHMGASKEMVIRMWMNDVSEASSYTSSLCLIAIFILASAAMVVFILGIYFLV